MQDITALIPARLNSSRVEQKVFQSLDGKTTLLERKIRQLRCLLPKDRVLVNTESSIIADHAEKAGAQVEFRDPYYADGHLASFSELIMHVIKNIKTTHIAWTPFVVPFFDETEFRQSFNSYDQNVIHGPYDSQVSVTLIKDYIWDESKPINYEATKRHTISQELPKWHQVTNGNYMAPKEVMLRNQYVLGTEVFLDVRSSKCKIDIDTIDDLKLAQAYHDQK